MILTTTNIRRAYKIIGVFVSSGKDDGVALDNLKDDVKHYYPKSDAIIGVRMFYSPWVDGEQYRAYGTVVKFK